MCKGPNGAFRYVVRPALRGKPKPRPTGVVDYRAPVESRTSAHDAIFERTVQRRWNRTARPQSAMDWLWQLDSVGARDRSARNIEPAERAVDLLLTAGLP
ncbi:MAG: hypothetical protein A2V70_13220 [Planctomycetes bacterium RBG_13_63_9]|nr:MAG: hypothetical protein A2V70_13220 [Planctomycetes bacterium RBG_13_63_9]